jgi:hypothetical protein
MADDPPNQGEEQEEEFLPGYASVTAFSTVSFELWICVGPKVLSGLRCAFVN